MRRPASRKVRQAQGSSGAKLPEHQDGEDAGPNWLRAMAGGRTGQAVAQTGPDRMPEPMRRRAQVHEHGHDRSHAENHAAAAKRWSRPDQGGGDAHGNYGNSEPRNQAKA